MIEIYQIYRHLVVYVNKAQKETVIARTRKTDCVIDVYKWLFFITVKTHLLKPDNALLDSETRC